MVLSEIQRKRCGRSEAGDLSRTALIIRSLLCAVMIRGRRPRGHRRVGYPAIGFRWRLVSCEINELSCGLLDGAPARRSNTRPSIEGDSNSGPGSSVGRAAD